LFSQYVDEKEEIFLITNSYIVQIVLSINTLLLLLISRVLAVRPARRTDASAPLSSGAASPPPLLAWGGENLLHPSSPVKETVQ
jgi:hypothetical protein